MKTDETDLKNDDISLKVMLLFIWDKKILILFVISLFICVSIFMAMTSPEKASPVMRPAAIILILSIRMNGARKKWESWWPM